MCSPVRGAVGSDRRSSGTVPPMTSFVISILGDDRAGLVEALSRVIAEHDGNWERSHMTHLAGKFAGVVLATIPQGHEDDFVSSLEPLEQQGLFRVAVEEGDGVTHDGPSFDLRLVGTDHPGIVHQLSHLLASKGVSIDNLATDTIPAPMSGGTLFEAEARLRLPAGMTADEVGGHIEALAADIMVDIDIVTDVPE